MTKEDYCLAASQLKEAHREEVPNGVAIRHESGRYMCLRALIDFLVLQKFILANLVYIDIEVLEKILATFFNHDAIICPLKTARPG
jgi:hypothetical protein